MSGYQASAPPMDPPAYPGVYPSVPVTAASPDELASLEIALGDLAAPALRSVIMRLAQRDAGTCHDAAMAVAAVGAGPSAITTGGMGERSAPPPSSVPVAAAVAGGAVIVGGGAAAAATAAAASSRGPAHAATYEEKPCSPDGGAPAAAAAAGPAEAAPPAKKGGFMDSLKSGLSSMGESARIMTAQAAVALNVKYDSQSFRRGFGLDATEPLLSEEVCTLLNGPYRCAGQLYITPHLFCVYTVTNNKEIKVVIRLADVVDIRQLSCLNIKGKTQPEITEPLPDTRPNVLQITCTSGEYHTVVLETDMFLLPSNMLAIAWDGVRADGMTRLMAPPSARPYHAKFGYPASEPLFGMHKCLLVNGAGKCEIVAHLFLVALCFEVGLTPVNLPIASISRIEQCNAQAAKGAAAAVLSPTPAGFVTNAIKLYTSDGNVHQMYGFAKHFEKAFNQLMFIWATTTGNAPAYM